MKKQENTDSKKEDEVILTKDSLVFVRSWLENNRSSIPSEILPFILAMLDMCDDAQILLKNNKKLVDLLRQYMGFVPTKERDGKNKAKTTDDNWTKEGENSLHEKMKKARQKWREYKDKKPPKKPKKNNSCVKKPGSSEQNEDAAHDHGSRQSGAEETVFQLPAAQINHDTKERPVDRNQLPTNQGRLSSSWQKRTRFDVSLSITITDYKVETVQCLESGFATTASLHDDGPSRFKITWTGMVQIVLLVVGMCIPMVRLASCLGASISYFNPSRIYRICLYTARACLSIYLEIFKQLATCDILSGDDTNNIVLAMQKDNQNISADDATERVELLAKSKAEPDPQKADIRLEAEELLGSQMPTKNGKGVKQSVFTTVVIGQRTNLGPLATLIFYHSERKSFGDVLGKILGLRKKIPSLCATPVVIQSDLSSSNIPNPHPTSLPLTFAGCISHARRPFWRYRNDLDPSIGYHCYTMLLLFDKICDSDRDARATLSESIINKARLEVQRQLWDELKKQALEILEDFAPNSEMAKAANYIINNFPTLTYYLQDSRLKPDNNQAERLLRYEKVMLDNSKFRVSKLGRLVYDVLRSILATCTAANVSPFNYLVYVLKNQLDARANPSNYTPFAYAIKENSAMPLSKND